MIDPLNFIESASQLHSNTAIYMLKKNTTDVGEKWG